MLDRTFNYYFKKQLLIISVFLQKKILNFMQSSKMPSAIDLQLDIYQIRFEELLNKIRMMNLNAK